MNKFLRNLSILGANILFCGFIQVNCYAQESNEIIEPLCGITYGGGQFVVVGNGIIATSSDGNFWAKQTWGSCGGVDVTYGDGWYVAVGGETFISNDGKEWEKTSEKGGSGVTYGGGKFVAVNGDARISTDGISWQEHTIGPCTSFAVTWGEPGYVAVGYQDLWRPVAYYSSDGINWEQTFYFDISGAGFRDIVYADSRYVSGGYKALTICSIDGVNWERGGCGVWLEGITYGKDKYVVVSDLGEVTTSPDGKTWSFPVGPICNYLADVAYGNSQFVAIGNAYDPVREDYIPVIFTSPDAYDWTRRVPPISPTPTPAFSPTPTPLGTPDIAFLNLSSGDYNGDGTADIAVFRPAKGLWVIRHITRWYYGDDGDIAVSGDYDGDGSTDIAVYGPSNGLWAVKNVTRVYWGAPGDIPFPRDYNGDGSCEIAVFNSGVWSLRGLSTIYYGSSQDRPLAGDYDGDGSSEIAVFRPGPGLWAIRGISRLYFGKQGDVPIPGDYDGDGTPDSAVFRPATGFWAIRGVTRTYLGTVDDWTVPADYSGNGTTRIGIFRDRAGLWAIRGISRIYFGKTGDVPLAK